MPSQASAKSAMSANVFPALPSQASVKSAMSASSLQALPVEIITEIFKSTDDFSTATALGATCRAFQSIFKENAASICHALLVRTITCYDQAFQYVQVQYSNVQQLDTVSSGPPGVTDLLAAGVTEKFLKNADDAHEALQLYEAQMIQKVSKAPEGGPWSMQNCPSTKCLTEAQRECFLQAWYRLNTLASLPSDPVPYSILASLDRLEFEQMRDVLRWLWSESPPRYRIMSNSGIVRGDYRLLALVKPPITRKHWYELEGRLNSLFKELPRDLSRGSSFWRFILHEVCLDIEELRKGGSLADKLPPMDKQDTPHHFTDSFHGFISRGAAAQQRLCYLA